MAGDRLGLMARALERGAFVAASLAMLAPLVAGAPQARAADPVTSCPVTITSCGCTITDAAVHTLGGNLLASQGLNKDGSCINIRHSFATLDGNDDDVEGAGSGIGIRILKGAKRVSVQNFAFIETWAVGIEDDGNGALISPNDDLSGNSTAGLLLKNVSRSVVTFFDALGNGTGILLMGTRRSVIDAFDATCDDCSPNGTGVALVRSNNNSIQDFSANANTGDGVDLTNSNNNFIVSFDAGFVGAEDDDGNGGNGVKLTHSSRNSIIDFTSSENGGVGVLLDPGSKGNLVGDADIGNFDGDSDFNNGGNGVEVDKGSTGNSVFFLSSFNTGTDLVDNNTNCDKNVWSNLCFDTESQACIGTEATRC